MPIFDYRCNECSTLYDVLHKGKEITNDFQCPSCGSFHDTKLMSLPSIIINGTSASQCDSHSCGLDDASCCGGGGCSLN